MGLNTNAEISLKLVLLQYSIRKKHVHRRQNFIGYYTTMAQNHRFEFLPLKNIIYTVFLSPRKMKFILCINIYHVHMQQKFKWKQ